MSRKKNYAPAAKIRALKALPLERIAESLGIPISYVARVLSRRDVRGPLPGSGRELRIDLPPEHRAEVLELIAKKKRQQIQNSRRIRAKIR